MQAFYEKKIVEYFLKTVRIILMTTKTNNYNTGVAAEYFILSQLFRQDVEAYITMGNKKAVDIRVLKNDGTAISVDVKAVRGYSSLIVNNMTYSKDHVAVFVVYNNKFTDVDIMPDVFVVPSMDVFNLKRKYGKELRIMKSDILPYKNKWSNITY